MKRSYILTTILENGKRLKPVIRKTEKGISDYANRQFRKYGENVTVEYGYFDENMNWIKSGVYHA